MFRDLVELSSDWFWEQDTNFRYTAMSGGVVNKGNFLIEATLGKARWELPIVGVSEDEWVRHRTQLERHDRSATLSTRSAPPTAVCCSRRSPVPETAPESVIEPVSWVVAIVATPPVPTSSVPANVASSALSQVNVVAAPSAFIESPVADASHAALDTVSVDPPCRVTSPV